MRKSKEQKAITLIALIITIVVLLILAAVAISSITNDGILSYATNAAKDYNKAVLNEKYYLTELEEFLTENQTGVKVEKVTDANPGKLEGTGTQADPYMVNSMEDFVFFSYDVNSGNTYEGKYVKLEYDLDFNSTKSYVEAFRTDYSKYGYNGELKTALTSGEGFIPIGTTSNIAHDGNRFAGTFDGNGKTISNLRINKENNIVTDIGLFTANVGEIKNLGMKDCNISLNCAERPNDWTACGAICGTNWGKINNCWTSGNIEIIWSATTHLAIGGIAGSGNTALNTEASVSNCYNKININAVQNSSASNGRHLYVGGIVANANNMYIENCYNSGNLTGEQMNGTRNIGVGGITGIGSPLSRCYNLGKIEGKKVSGNPSVGGISGGVSKNVEYCCNVGEVIYEGTSAYTVGTLLGYTEGTLSNSYALTNAQLNGIGKNWSSTPEPTKVNTVAEMPTILEIVGNGFKADTNNINNGYPILSWQ